MVGACVTVAQSSDYKPAWNGQPPADFGVDIAQLATDYGGDTGKRFIEAWKRARIIVDSGGGGGGTTPTPAPTPTQ